MSFPSHFPMVCPPRGGTVNHWESLLQALLQHLAYVTVRLWVSPGHSGGFVWQGNPYLRSQGFRRADLNA